MVDYIKINLNRTLMLSMFKMMIDYITVSPIKVGRRDTLKVDDIIIFEFTTPYIICIQDDDKLQ
jgi:hypothetical protein